MAEGNISKPVIVQTVTFSTSFSQGDSFSIAQYLNSTAIAVVIRKHGKASSQILITSVIKAGAYGSVTFPNANIATDPTVVLAFASDGTVTVTSAQVESNIELLVIY